MKPAAQAPPAQMSRKAMTASASPEATRSPRSAKRTVRGGAATHPATAPNRRSRAP